MFIEIGEFLNLRLKQMGIQHLFGVPGDFNLSYLEQVEADPQLEFIGNCNELNAAYAADGYARINGFSALATTYGVGDLSALMVLQVPMQKMYLLFISQVFHLYMQFKRVLSYTIR